MSDISQYHKQRLAQLRTDRSNWEAQWEEAAMRVLPADRDSFSSQGTNRVSPEGQKKTEYQFDATAGLAAHRFASVIESLVTPKGSIWHYLTTVDKSLKRNRRVREYFEDMTTALFRHRYAPGSGFVTNTQQVYLALGVYGNGSIYIDTPEDRKGLRYRAIHLSESYFVENHQHIVDGCYRPFYLTARQAVQQFGKQVPDQVLQAAGQPTQSEKKFQFLHVVVPNTDFTPGMLGPQGKRFASMYLSIEPEGMLVRGGYGTFPYAVSRYTQAAGELYGRGPAQHVLPAIKLLNEEKKTNLKQGHRAADPILLAHDDGTLDGFVMRSGYLNKGGVNADGKLLVQALPTGNFAINEKLMEMERAIINDAFLISLFQILVDNPQMTATEVLERMREKGMLLAPTAGRQEEEFLGPMIDREIDVLASQGLLPPVPQILVDARDEIQYTVEYDSPMSRMRRAEGAAGFTRTLTTIAEYVKFTGDPAPLDYVNFDRATPELLDINGVPVSWTSTEEEVAAKRDERAKAQQAEQLAKAAPGMAQMIKAMPEAAKAAPPA